MASIKIHQDLYNFKRKRNGMTGRQIGSIIVAIPCIAFGTWLLVWCLGLPMEMSGFAAVMFAVPAIACGWFPMWGMPLERFLARGKQMDRRGNCIVSKWESYEPEGSELSRAQIKAEKAKGYEAAAR